MRALALALALLMSGCSLERIRASDLVGVWKFDSFFAPFGTSQPKSVESSTLELRADGTCTGVLPAVLINARSDSGDPYSAKPFDGKWNLEFSESNNCQMIRIWSKLPEGTFGFGFFVNSQFEIVDYVGDPDSNHRFILRKEK